MIGDHRLAVSYVAGIGSKPMAQWRFFKPSNWFCDETFSILFAKRDVERAPSKP
jgi:hypothetical protein